LKEMVEQAIGDFKGKPEEVVVYAKYVWDENGI
jgi:hypothetical protein